VPFSRINIPRRVKLVRLHDHEVAGDIFFRNVVTSHNTLIFTNRSCGKYQPHVQRELYVAYSRLSLMSSVRIYGTTFPLRPERFTNFLSDITVTTSSLKNKMIFSKCYASYEIATNL